MPICNLELSVSHHIPDIGSSGRGFSWFSSDPPVNVLILLLTTWRKLPFTYFPVHHSLTIFPSIPNQQYARATESSNKILKRKIYVYRYFTMLNWLLRVSWSRIIIYWESNGERIWLVFWLAWRNLGSWKV